MVKMNSSLYNLVNKMIIKHPDRLAVQFDNGEQLSAISYTQLRNISSLVMKLLHGRESEVIGLCLYTDHRLPAILLGVLGCKAAFYNFDAKGFMYARQVLKDVGTQILLVHKSFIQVIKNQIKDEEVVYTPVSVQGLEDYFVIQFTCIARKYCKTSLAYCITTSGTTGKPKVVMVPNECIVPNILHLSKLFSVTSDDLVLGATVLTFDPSIIEIFIALSVGACVLMVPPTVKMIPDRLLDIIHVRNKVTVIQVTPTLFSRFDASKLSDTILGDKSNVRVIALGGERFPSCTWLQSMRSTGNQTCFYNLYGTTEVSCWATCYKVTDIDFKLSEEVPLGDPLQDTVIEVHDGVGNIVTEGTGMLWIGGSRRQCMEGVNEELNFDHVVVRDTGDMVRIHNNNIYYISRKDQQMKRNGRRMNLEEIKMVLKKHEYVHDVEVLLIDNQLIVFIVPSHLAVNSEMINIYMKDNLPSHWWPDVVITIANLPVTQHGKCDKKALEKIYFDRDVDGERIDITEYLESMWKELTDRSTSSTCIPETENFILAGGDSLKAVQLANVIENMYNILLPQLVDIVLHKTYCDVRKYVAICVQQELQNGANVKSSENDQRLVTDNLNLKEGHGIDMKSGGGSSDKQGFSDENVCLTENENIAKEVKARRTDDSGDGIGNKKYVDKEMKIYKELTVCSKTADSKLDYDEKFFDKVKKVSKKRKLSGEHGLSNKFSLDLNDIQFTLRRCSQCDYVYGYKADGVKHKTMITKASNVDEGKEKCTTMVAERYILTLEEVWKNDTGKCVDASPLLLVKSRGEFIVMIGSHSHRFSALYGSTGKKLWETTLPDRIESSACLSTCANFVIVGCYDGSVYILHINNGDIWWQFETGSQVKCSPVVDTQTGLVYIGSHSQTVYCLDVRGQKVIWERDLKSGSIFSSPCISNDPHHLYISTLGGKIFTLDPSSGETIWEYILTKPAFSSPTLTSQGVCVGCTDMYMYHFNFNGTLLWKYLTNGHIFSSPSYKSRTLSTRNVNCAEDNCAVSGSTKDDSIDIDQIKHTGATSGYITFGSHDKYLYCVTNDGKLVWKLQVDSAVYSSPFQCIINCNSNNFDDYFHTDDFNKFSKPHISEGQVKQNALESWYTGIPEQEFEQNQAGNEATSEKKVLTKSEFSNKDDNHQVSENDNPCKIMSDCEMHVVVFASTSGTLYVVDVPTGVLLCKQHLDGEIFSSPVVYNNTVIVGCRNDFVYCFKISSDQSNKSDCMNK